MDVQLCVTIAIGSVYHTDTIFRDCTISIDRKILPTALIQLGIQGCDVILGMDWLNKYKLTIECENKLISFSTPKGIKSVYRGEQPS